jgi:hypothetical protein
MGFFGLLFWIAVFWLAFRVFRSWNGYGSRGYWSERRLDRREALEDQQPHIDALESRVAELEERLDFTERLVAERASAAHNG